MHLSLHNVRAVVIGESSHNVDDERTSFGPFREIAIIADDGGLVTLTLHGTPEATQPALSHEVFVADTARLRAEALAEKETG